jgi:hypothetical protein
MQPTGDVARDHWLQINLGIWSFCALPHLLSVKARLCSFAKWCHRSIGCSTLSNEWGVFLSARVLKHAQHTVPA